MVRYDGQMNTLIALLRAVNVGGSGKMPMADLRNLADAAGLHDARTYIQSGNLIVSTDKTPSDAKSALEEELAKYAGKPVGVVMRMAQEMRKVLDANPFPDAEPSKVGVLFLDDSPPPDAIETAKGKTDEVIILGTREIYVHYPSGMGQSKLRMTAMSDGTMRNINTVSKLAKMASEP